MPDIIVIPPLPCPLSSRTECRGPRCKLFEQPMGQMLLAGTRFAKACSNTSSAYKQILEEGVITTPHV